MKESLETLEAFKERLARARNRLLRHEPFLGFMTLELPTRILEAEQPITTTAATDGSTYYYNYHWCRQLTDPELVFVVAHEVAHVLLLHGYRRNGRAIELWNVACDFAINGMLEADCQNGSLRGIAVMPFIANPQTGRPQRIGLWEKRFSNWTAERIYDQLEQEQAKLTANWDQLLEPSSDRKMTDVEGQARAAVARSLVRAREHRQRHGHGDEQGGWERLAEAGLSPTVAWQYQFRRRVRAWGSDTISWIRPSSKYRPHGYYFPRHRGYQLPNILFAFDTSGSISDRFLGQMVAELNGLLALARSSIVRVVCCDTEIRPVGDFHAGRSLDPNQHSLRGGGGTDFRPIFEYARHEARFGQLICLTDAAGTYPESNPKNIDTLWLIPHDLTVQPPFGEVISLPFSTNPT